jgi:hypothetical protein
MAKTTRTPRTRRTRAEVQQELAEVEREAAAARESSDPKAVESAHHHEAEIRQAVEGVSVEGAVKTIASLNLEVSKALAELSEKLVGEVTHLATVREAVALERAELDRLHKIDVAATARRRSGSRPTPRPSAPAGKRSGKPPSAPARSKPRSRRSSGHARSRTTSTALSSSASEPRTSTPKSCARATRPTERSRKRSPRAGSRVRPCSRSKKRSWPA